MIILVLHGPNLGILGKRELEIYGTTKLSELNEIIRERAKELGIVIKVFQTNHEGKLIDFVEEHHGTSDALIINAGGLTHTSISLMDAVKAFGKPVVEVHLTDPAKREEFRHISYIGMVSEKTFVGKGVVSYLEALDYLYNKYGE